MAIILYNYTMEFAPRPCVSGDPIYLMKTILRQVKAPIKIYKS